MITKETIERINELARKKREFGLSEIELKEQAKLRKLYIGNIKTQLRDTLECIEFVDEPAKTSVKLN